MQGCIINNELLYYILLCFIFSTLFNYIYVLYYLRIMYQFKNSNPYDSSIATLINNVYSFK